MKPSSFSARAQRRFALLVLSLPAGLQRWLAGPPEIREGRRLDTQVQLLLRLQRLAGGGKGWDDTPVPVARRQLEAECDLLTSVVPEMEHIESLSLPGPAGAIPARVYRPAGSSRRAPALVYFHGGGFVLGNLDSHDTPCRQIASEVGCVVIAVDYRLAPEYPFPAGVQDAIAAFRALASGAESLGLDPARLAIGGDSAGANLAAVVAQQTRSDVHRPCFQLLVYPTTDLTMSFPSIRTFAKGFLLQKASMDWFLDHYLPPGQDKRDPLGSPLYGDVIGLPPAMVQTAGFDPLCDEGEAYVQHLQGAGVTVTHRRYEGLVHGYLHMTDAVTAARAPLEDLLRALQQAFAPASAVRTDTTAAARASA
jgi:acetyl esterase